VLSVSQHAYWALATTRTIGGWDQVVRYAERLADLKKTSDLSMIIDAIIVCTSCDKPIQYYVYHMIQLVPVIIK